jgi:PhzF family phenazine biosynthesis protein
MNRITVYHYDAFTETPNMGNPAGVVINAEHLTHKQMQEIAYKVGFNETAFVLKSNKADLRIRYYTPGHEMNLCGHATIATLYALNSRKLLHEVNKITIETNASVLGINFFEKHKRPYILMEHTHPIFKNFKGSIDELANSLGLNPSDIDTSLPTVYGSTGAWTLLVPIKTLEAFSRMMPQNKLFPTILTELPHCSIHPFCLETTNLNAHMHARHFSSPLSGTIEDPVTGTASGVMGAYYITYIEPSINEIELIVEQGEELCRHGEVCVHVRRNSNEINISISGTAVYTNEIIINYE